MISFMKHPPPRKYRNQIKNMYMCFLFIFESRSSHCVHEQPRYAMTVEQNHTVPSVNMTLNVKKRLYLYPIVWADSEVVLPPPPLKNHKCYRFQYEYAVGPQEKLGPPHPRKSLVYLRIYNWTPSVCKIK